MKDDLGLITSDREVTKRALDNGDGLYYVENTDTKTRAYGLIIENGILYKTIMA